MSEKAFDRARLVKLLSEMGFDGESGGEFHELTAPEMRTLIDEGFLELDDYANECLEIDYCLDVMERVDGVTAYGSLWLDKDGLSLSIEGLELYSADPEKQVELLLATHGADETYRIEPVGIGVWWD